MKIKLFIHIFLIVLGLVFAIGGVWASAYTMHVLTDWGTVPSIVTGMMCLVGGLVLIFFSSFQAAYIMKEMKL